jgi:tetratricopeptide (TPR) repeat protein
MARAIGTCREKKRERDPRPLSRRALALIALFLFAASCAARAPVPRQPEGLQAAEIQMRQGHFDQARSAILAVLTKDPTSVEAWNLLGIVEAAQRDNAGALIALRRALELDPHSARTHNNLGNVFIADNKPDLAENEFRTVLRLDPGNRDANYNLATLLMTRDLPAAAIPYLERISPRDRDTSLRLIDACLRSRRTVEALRLATALSAQTPGDPELHLTLGVLLATHGQYSAAELELEKADALRPDTFEILYDLGQTYLLDNRSSQAQFELTQALRVQPNSTSALYLLADSHWKQSQPLDALELLVRAHKLSPQNTDVILLMARISMSQGYYEDAIPLLQSGLKLAPQRSDLRSALGESYFKSDQIGKAILAFRAVVATNPSARAYSFLGLSHTYLGQYATAEQDFRNGLKLDPRCGFCLFSLGYIAERQGNSAEAEGTFRRVLVWDPDFPDALLELANLEIQSEHYQEAETLLKHYVRVSQTPAPGYYKLAMVERKLHRNAEASENLAQFEKFSTQAIPSTYLYENLFDYLDHRSELSPYLRRKQDLTELLGQNRKHPDQPEILYMLAQAYLGTGDVEKARTTIAQLDQVRAGDYRTPAGAGVLFARYRLYDDAIRQFQAALRIEPRSDDVKFDLANALFRKGDYPDALDAMQQVSAQEHDDDAWLSLLADIYAHLGQTDRAEEIDHAAIRRSPDNDENYLSLALLQLRQGDAEAGRRTLLQGQSRVPASGKIVWGLGIAAVMQGNTEAAASDFERAVDLLPEWPGSFSMLGFFYFQTGQISRAREVLDRFRNSSAAGGLDVSRIEAVLNEAPQGEAAPNAPLPTAKREQLLQMALLLADRTL